MKSWISHQVLLKGAINYSYEEYYLMFKRQTTPEVNNIHRKEIKAINDKSLRFICFVIYMSQFYIPVVIKSFKFNSLQPGVLINHINSWTSFTSTRITTLQIFFISFSSFIPSVSADSNWHRNNHNLNKWASSDANKW